MPTSKRYYILKIDSYEGEGSSLYVNAGSSESMYTVLLVTDKSAEVVDWGYESLEELFDAWQGTTFENLGEYQ